MGLEEPMKLRTDSNWAFKFGLGWEGGCGLATGLLLGLGKLIQHLKTKKGYVAFESAFAHLD